MRTIKFRGKTDQGKWEYGDLATFLNSADTMKYFVEGWLVLPETVGQFTGLYDINGKEIYEGDILQGLYNGVFFKLVYWDNDLCAFALKDDDYTEPLGYVDMEEYNYTVVGNVFDTPELLEVKNEND